MLKILPIIPSSTSQKLPIILIFILKLLLIIPTIATDYDCIMPANVL